MGLIVDDTLDDSDIPAPSGSGARPASASSANSTMFKRWRQKLAMAGTNPANVRNDIKQQRSSWKDMVSIRDMLKKTLGFTEAHSRSREQRAGLLRTKLNALRERAARAGNARLDEIIKLLRLKDKGGGLFGSLGNTIKTIMGNLLGSASGIASLVAAYLAGKYLPAIFRKTPPGGRPTKSLWGRTKDAAKKGWEKAKGLTRKVMSTRVGVLAGNVFGGLRTAVSDGLGRIGATRAGGFAARAAAYGGKRLAALGVGLVSGPAGWALDVALIGKMIWDLLFPEKWKEAIKYRVAKMFLKAVAGFSKLAEWFSKGMKSLKDAASRKLDEMTAALSGFWDYLKKLVTLDPEAVESFKVSAKELGASAIKKLGEFWDAICGTIESLTLYVKEFMAPFYDSSGKFSVKQGFDYYMDRMATWERSKLSSIGSYLSSWHPIDDAQSTVDAYEKKNPELKKVGTVTVSYLGRKHAKAEPNAQPIKATATQYGDGSWEFDGSRYPNDDAFQRAINEASNVEDAAWEAEKAKKKKLTRAQRDMKASGGKGGTATGTSPGAKGAVKRDGTDTIPESKVGKPTPVSPVAPPADAKATSQSGAQTSVKSTYAGRPNYANAPHENSVPAIGYV